MRKILINAIVNLAGDEYETKEDWVELAAKTEEELIKELIDIALYYMEQANQFN